VAVCGRNLSKLPENYREKCPRLSGYSVDVTDRDGLVAAVQTFANSGEKGLDIMVANAGISVGSKTRIPQFSAAVKIMNVNVIGVLNTMEGALEIMRAQGHGHIVAVSSVAGFVGLPGAAAYSASKSAVTTLMESWSIDLAPENIAVTTICPGFIDTPLTQQNPHAMPFMMSSEKGAQIIRRAIDKKKALLLFPWQMRWLILFLNKLPRFIYRRIMTLPFANFSKG
jgi:NAD(P)-dependent dehydrogenase (short-subunit alcohol dehydrogenase family)